MKILSIILSVLAIAIVVFNVTKLDFNNLFAGDSLTALICITASLCAILLLQILSVSKKIEQKVKS